MTDRDPPSADRRRDLRHVACFPGYVERKPDDKTTAIIADVAPGGALILVRGHNFHVGQPLRLELYIAIDSSEPRVATGHVVRIEPLPEDRVSLWTHQVGVEFDEPIALGTDEVAALDERQAKLGVHRPAGAPPSSR